MERKQKYILCGIVFIIVAVLLIICGFFINTKNNFQLALYIVETILLLVFFIFCFVDIAKKNIVWLIIKVVIACLTLPLVVLCVIFVERICGWLLFSAAIFGFVGYLLILASNIGFKGKAPMPYWRKFCEVLIQIAILPISAFVTACWAFCLIGGHYLSGVINQRFFICFLKGRDLEEDHFYNVGESDKLVETTVTHELSDGKGHFVGTYDTKEYSIEHDDGNRYDISDQLALAMGAGLIAIPKRVICLILSIIALFVPKMYVSVKRLYTPYRYYQVAFNWLDLIVYY